MQRSMVKAMRGVQIKDRKNLKSLMQTLGLNTTIDQLAIVNIVSWYWYMLRREHVHF